MNKLAAWVRGLFARREIPDVPEDWRATRGKGTRILVIDSGLPDHRVLRGVLDVEASRSFVWESDIWDRCGHATAVCGIIHDHAPGARIACYKVAKDEAAAKAVDSVDLRLAFEAACDLKPDVVCCAVCFSAGVSKVMHALGILESLGIPVVCAAGNDADAGVAYPARFAQAIAVGACDRRGREAKFSPPGDIDCLFPGVRVSTLWLHGGRASVSGTSFAAPCAAAVAALYLSFVKSSDRRIVKSSDGSTGNDLFVRSSDRRIVKSSDGSTGDGSTGDVLSGAELVGAVREALAETGA